MNSRIKQLAEQAGFDYDPIDKNFYSPDTAQWINKEIFAFADALIKECAEIMIEKDSYYGEWMADTIVQHFKD